ncbi:hypothetical protein ACF08M_19810 [Streptomyces sp. NPDC015032]|uniref:hypothetical protein n=1 Tax=Streptomyces sp. NPDC015032 TaxID=3364937 RepID=UPI0036F7482B
MTGASVCTSGDGATRGQPPAAGATTSGRTGAERVLVPDARACENGTYTWFNTRRLPVPDGVTEPHRVTAGRTGFTEPVRRLRTDMASPRSDGPKPDPDAVLFVLARHLGPGFGWRDARLRRAAARACAGRRPRGRAPVLRPVALAREAATAPAPYHGG